MEKKKKILIVRFSSIGDIVLCSPIVRCVKKQLNGEIHFVTKAHFLPLIKDNPYLDKCWTFKKDITECIASLKAQKFDLVIDLHKNLRSKRLVANLAVKTVSFDKLNIQKWIRVHLGINYLPKKHLIDRYFESMGALQIKDDGLGMDFFINEKELSKEVKNLSIKNGFISLVLGANYLTKRVPIHLVEYLLSTFVNETFVLIGGKDVLDEALQLQRKYPNLVNMVDQCDLQGSAYLLSKSSMVITGDTGMMHIAAALKKPIISIWGGTHHDLGMYPFYGFLNPDLNVSMVNENISCSPCSKIGKHRCPKGHFKCMMDQDKDRLSQSILRLKKAT